MFPARLRHGDETFYRVGDAVRLGDTRYFARVVDLEFRPYDQDDDSDMGEWFARLQLGPIDLGWVPEARPL